MSYLATMYCISGGVGVANSKLPSFDKALLNAGIGNYNLVRLSSILPCNCKRIGPEEISAFIGEGSLLPTAYATISSARKGDHLCSTIGIGLPVDKSKVCVIMEHSTVNQPVSKTVDELMEMIHDAFDERGWELEGMVLHTEDAIVEEEGVTVTTFACVSEWN